MADFIYAYPKEVPQYYCRIALKRYERPKPGSAVVKNTAGAIRLPMPSQITDDYGIRTNTPHFDLLGNIDNRSDIYTAGQAKIDEFMNDYAAGRGLSSALQTAVQAAATLPGLSDTGASAYVQSAIGLVRNPHLTTIFDQVELKSYNFAWKMSPRSQEEANTINLIIAYLKKYMHPKIAAGGFALEYPYLATLQFEAGDVQYPLLPTVRPSFITKLDVDSTAGGVAFFRDGNPVAVELRIGFQEINTLTQEDFSAGL